MLRFKFTIFNHGFKVRALYGKDKIHILSFYDGLAKKEIEMNKITKEKRMVTKEVYATAENRGVYGFHISSLESMLLYLDINGVKPDEISKDIRTHYDGVAKSNIKLTPAAKPRNDPKDTVNQEDVINNFLLDKKFNTFVLPLQTGKGKTFISLYTIAKLGVRTAVVMGASHIDTWIRDSSWIYEDSESKFRPVKGGDGLKELINDGLNGLIKHDILLFSVNTLRDYLTDYEENGRSSYGCEPDVLWEILGVGSRFTDEAHENLHFGFRLDILTNCRRCTYLSATIESKDRFKDNLYNHIFPMKRRYLKAVWDRYANATALGWGLREPQKARYTGFNRMYSHMRFETYIMANKRLKGAYYEMIGDMVERGYVNKRKDGQKCLLFFSATKMCEEVSKYLEGRFPQFTHSDYTGKHDDMVLHEHDVVCTTVGSAGTGKDIKNLKTVILTVGINNQEKNTQIFGRLRKLTDDTPEFYYLVCKDIQKHIKYHEEKTKLLKKLAKNVKAVNTGYVL